MGNYRDNLFFTPLIASGFVMLVSAADVLADDETTVTTMYGMMKEKGYRCLECHDVEVKVVGPSWKEVSARRKGNPWATALIRYGRARPITPCGDSLPPTARAARP